MGSIGLHLAGPGAGRGIVSWALRDTGATALDGLPTTLTAAPAPTGPPPARGRVAEMTSQKHGISALGLQRVLGLGSYQTAWAMLHRYRAAMVRPGREQLSGQVEADETYVGGEEPGVSGRQTATTAIVAIAVEVRRSNATTSVTPKVLPSPQAVLSAA